MFSGVRSQCTVPQSLAVTSQAITGTITTSLDSPLKQPFDALKVNKRQCGGCSVKSSNVQPRIQSFGRWFVRARRQCSVGPQVSAVAFCHSMEPAHSSTFTVPSVCNVFRCSLVEEVSKFWQTQADPFGRASKGFDRKGLTEFVELA